MPMNYLQDAFLFIFKESMLIKFDRTVPFEFGRKRENVTYAGSTEGTGDNMMRCTGMLICHDRFSICLEARKM